MGHAAIKAISIECSKEMLSPLATNASTIERIDALTELAHTTYGVSVEFVIYQGMDSLYAGGRILSSSPEETEQSASAVNEHGISFALALNGGLTLPGKIGLAEGDIHVLQALERNGRTIESRTRSSSITRACCLL